MASFKTFRMSEREEDEKRREKMLAKNKYTSERTYSEDVSQIRNLLDETKFGRNVLGGGSLTSLLNDIDAMDMGLLTNSSMPLGTLIPTLSNVAANIEMDTPLARVAREQMIEALKRRLAHNAAGYVPMLDASTRDGFQPYSRYGLSITRKDLLSGLTGMESVTAGLFDIRSKRGKFGDTADGGAYDFYRSTSRFYRKVRESMMAGQISPFLPFEKMDIEQVPQISIDLGRIRDKGLGIAGAEDITEDYVRNYFKRISLRELETRGFRYPTDRYGRLRLKVKLPAVMDMGDGYVDPVTYINHMMREDLQSLPYAERYSVISNLYEGMIETRMHDDSEDFYWGVDGNLKNASPKDPLDYGIQEGLLKYTSKLFTEEDRKVQSPFELVGPGGTPRSVTPLNRNFTPAKPYGAPKTWIRSLGNGQDFSVLKNFVIPKIFPVLGRNGAPDLEAMCFTIENLAWTRDDLRRYRIPECEWGPNGGRLMWFAPYIASVSDMTSVHWDSHEFVGAIDKSATYKGRSSTMSLKFYLIADYQHNADLVDMAEHVFRTHADTYEFIKPFGQEVVVEETEDGTPVGRPTPVEADFTKGPIYYYYENDTPVVDVTYESEAYEKLPMDSLTKENHRGNYQLGLNAAYVTDRDSIKKDFLSQEVEGVKRYEYVDIIVETSSSKLQKRSDLQVVYNKCLALCRAMSILDDMLGTSASAYRNDVTSLDGMIAVAKGVLSGSKTFKEFFRWVVQDKENAYYRLMNVDKVTFNGQYGNVITLVNKAPDVFDTDGRFWRPEQKKSRYSSVTFQYPRKPIVPKVEEPVAVVPDGAPTLHTCRERFRQDNWTLAYYGELAARQTSLFEHLSRVHNLDKLKTFAAAFHSQTPEDLHRRLTFLHQCTAPGDTPEGVISSRNSSFGKAPHIIIRIGDFYHTRAVITSMSVNMVDNSTWDLNPEGMGVQPMALTIGLELQTYGGMSLKTHIERVQNAMSFNYRANSTIYGSNVQPGMETTVYDFAVREQENQLLRNITTEELMRNKRNELE